MPKRGLTQIEALILTQVAKQNTYGFVILKELGPYSYGVGTVYKTLNRITKFGFLRDQREKVSNHQGPPRRCYSITKKGQEALAEYKKQLTKLLQDLD